MRRNAKYDAANAILDMKDSSAIAAAAMIIAAAFLTRPGYEDAALGNLTSALTALQPSLRGKIGGIEDYIPTLARVDSPQR
ncbi:MAG: hypothetical protein ACR65U_13250 [Methylocystis sp.]